jgi:hypothetical protein
MIIIRPTGDLELREFDQPIPLETLQEGVGGDLEVVPYFNSISHGGTVLSCVAFCDEHGKLNHGPLNEPATMAWERAVSREGLELRDKSGNLKDFLVGPVVVVFGDSEFMAEL